MILKYRGRIFHTLALFFLSFGIVLLSTQKGISQFIHVGNPAPDNTPLLDAGNLTTNLVAGAVNQALFGFGIKAFNNLTLSRITIVATSSNLNENFIAGSYEMGTCPTSTYDANNFTVVPSNFVDVTTNPIQCNMSFPVIELAVHYFFFRANVRTSFNAGYPIAMTFSIARPTAGQTPNFFKHTDTNPYVTFDTNVPYSATNTVTPLNLAPSGVAYQWTDIPAATPLSDASKLARTWLNDGDTALTSGLTGASQRDNDDANASADNNWQAFGVVWATAQASVSSVKFYNGEINSTPHGYFDSAPSIQYSTDGTTWIAAGSTWAVCTPAYPVSSVTASYKTYILAGDPLTNVRGIRIIGQVRKVSAPSQRVHSRELEVSNRRTYYFKPVQSDLTVLGNWGLNPSDGTGIVPTAFNAADLFILTSNKTLSGDIISSRSTVFQVGNGGAGVTLTMGAFTVSNAFFNIPLASSGSNTLLLTTGTLPALGNLSTGPLGSTIEFNGTTTVPFRSYNYLKISGTGTKTLAASTRVSQGLSISGGGLGTPSSLAIGSNTLTLNGTFSGSDNNWLTANGSSNLSIGGTGALGTLFFDQATPGKSVGTGNTDFVALTQGTTNRLNNFTMNRTGSGTATLGNEMQITNALTPTAGTLNTGTTGFLASNLVMLSTLGKASSILELGASADISGNVNVQSFFKGGPYTEGRGYRMISNPINAVGAPDNFYQKMKERFIITGSTGPGGGFDPGGTIQPNAITFRSYVEPGLVGAASYSTPTNIADAVTVGRGYFFFFRGNRSNLSGKVNDASGVFPAAEDWTATYIGNINKGTIPIAVTRTNNGDAYDGYNLIGNPYPCTLDFDLMQKDLANSNIITSVVSIIRRDRLGYLTLANDVQNSGSGPIQVNPPQTTDISQGDISNIQTGQGFFVKVRNEKPGTSTLTFKESHKNTLLSIPLTARVLSRPEGGGVRIEGAKIATSLPGSKRQLIRLSLADSVNADAATVVLEPGNQQSYGGYDAAYFGGSTVNCNTLTSDDVSTAINFMPEVDSVSAIRIYVSSAVSNPSLKLSFTELTAVQGRLVLLSDRYKKTFTEIDTAHSTYSFGIDRDIAETFGKDRFELLIMNQSTLPLQLTDFTANRQNVGSVLSWKTGSEKNSASIEIERSPDGNSFDRIGSVIAAGESSSMLPYSFTDRSPVAGSLNYYRLKLLDRDGRYGYSEIRTVDFGLAQSESISIYPNPVADVINVLWKAKVKGDKQINIYDTSGRKIRSYNGVKGQKFSQNLGDLRGGVYVLEIREQSGGAKVGQQKFIKEK